MEWSGGGGFSDDKKRGKCEWICWDVVLWSVHHFELAISIFALKGGEMWWCDEGVDGGFWQTVSAVCRW